MALDAVTADQRRTAKMINFGLIYGMSAFGLARQLGIERSAGQHYMERYFARYPGVAEYMQRTRELARSQGYVETVFGRRLWLPEIRSSNAARRGNAERAAINAPMQGTAADLIKLAMIAVQRWIESHKLRTRLIMQVHDELVFEVPDEELQQVRAQHVPVVVVVLVAVLTADDETADPTRGQQCLVDGEVRKVLFDRQPLRGVQRLTRLDRVQRGRRVVGISGEGVRWKTRR